MRDNNHNNNNYKSKLKKSSSCHLATKWRTTVAICKFLVASLYNVNDTANSYNPGQNVLGQLLRKLGTKTHFAKLTHILNLLKKLGDVVIRDYFCCPPLPQAVLIVLN